MYNLKDLVFCLDNELNIIKISDYSINGLQVEGKEKVNKISFAVDLSLETIKKCAENKSDMIIVHHGIFWKNSQITITGIHKERIKNLLDNRISVYAAHLPLDLHPKYGNNAAICNLLNLKQIKSFGNYNGIMIGFYGNLTEKTELDKFIKLFEKKICKPNHIIKSNNFVKKIGVVSGGGAGLFYECSSLGIDTFVTGEQNYTVQNFAEEQKINIIFGGHYNTEIYGVKSLMNFIKKRYPGIKMEFIDIPSLL